jgi:hypothetical protein
MRNILALFLLSIFITACSGGGSSSQTSNGSPDTTAPITMSAPAVAGTTDIATNLSVTINENGNGYYLVQTAATSAPTIAAVQAGTAFAMAANVAVLRAINGLTASTAYKIYFIAKDAANNVQATLQSVAVTTAPASLVPDVTPPTTTIAPAVSGITDTMSNLSVTINESGTGYYLVQASAAAPPSITLVQAGTSFVITANVAATAVISGLSASTSYKIYFIAKDVANNVQTTLQSVAVTTTATPLPAGYVVQGGLIWMPVTFSDGWINADAYCANTTINGQTGWRMPTQVELSDLYTSGAMNGQGWTLSETWSSTIPNGSGSIYIHYYVSLVNGYIYYLDATKIFYVACVR